MIKDLSIAKNSNTLEEYYQSLYNLQSNAHGQDYMLVHNEIKKRIKECTSYTELGINQGTTLAVAVLQNIPYIRAYDISLSPYNNAKHLFNTYSINNKLNYKVYEFDTLKCDIDPTDLLYIDTKHDYKHLSQELKLHGHKAKKYIIFHDTHTQQGLKKAVLEYVERNKEWKVIEDCQQSVGFMTIGK